MPQSIVTDPRDRSIHSETMMPLEILQTINHGLNKTPHFASLPIDLPLPSPISAHHAFLSLTETPSLEELGFEVARKFNLPCDVRRMLQMSSRIKEQYYIKLESSTECMLPSFCHALPSGQECGTFVALDVGGSTMRVALIELSRRTHKRRADVTIKRMTMSRINESIRRLPADDFFRWMAQNILDMIKQEQDFQWTAEQPISLGLTWSFPLEQTSHRSARVLGMGKGFACHNGTVGQDLGSLLETACRSLGFAVRLEAIINDASATLLSQAYLDPSTSMGLIMGTGTNAAAFFPVVCMSRAKFGNRDPKWFSKAERVITNTELSMFGKGVLPETRWDAQLNRDHKIPDFQPLEYMTTGRYLGEILRLVIVEAVDRCGLFGGELPSAIQSQYTLDTTLLARIEEDTSRNLATSAAKVQTELGLASVPSNYEMAFLRTVVEAISHRAAAYLAVAIHALWLVQKETDVNLTTPMGTPKTSIACNGSVILKYPGLKARCENYISDMIFTGSGGGIFRSEKVVLEPTDEAAIVGAAVAVAMGEGT
ncbi:hypothetical protein R6Q59_009997 [Mikania micrantha]